MPYSPVFEAPVDIGQQKLGAVLEDVVVFITGAAGPVLEEKVQALPFILGPVLEEQVNIAGSVLGPVLEGAAAPLSDGIDGRQLDPAAPLTSVKLQLTSLTAAELAQASVGGGQLADGAVSPQRLSQTYLRRPLFLTASPEAFREQAGVDVPDQSVVADEDALVFPPSVDRGGRFAITLPEGYDDNERLELFLVMRNPGASGGGRHLVETSFRINGGPLSVATKRLLLPVGTTQARTVSVLSIPASLVSPGDALSIRLLRLGSDAQDTEAQNMEIYRFIIRAPSSL